MNSRLLVTHNPAVCRFRILQHLELTWQFEQGNLDGFILSYTREPVQVPEQKAVDKFLPVYKPVTYLDPKKPMNLGVPVMEEYTDFRLQQQAAMENARDVIKETFKEWEKKFRRK